MEMFKHIYIVVPKLVNSGPVKGAIALYNLLKENHKFVFLVTLKKTKDNNLLVNTNRINIISLEKEKNFFSRVKKFNFLLSNSNKKSHNILISYGFSADLFVAFFNKKGTTVSSVRGHLNKTYKFDYGILGKFILYLHIRILTVFDYQIAMTKNMSLFFKKYMKKKPIIIGNFIDEKEIEKFRNKLIFDENYYHFIFIGRLYHLKNPKLVLNSILELRKQFNIDCSLSFFGEGPLRKDLEKFVKKNNLSEYVKFFGQVDNPWKFISNVSALILPSKTEGISRSVLEALYLGIPCVLKNVDSNKELINVNNGIIIDDEKELTSAILRLINTNKKKRSKKNILLNKEFRETFCKKKYLHLISKL